MAESCREGALVVHPAFGLGKVILVSGDKVWVYFKDIEGSPKDAVKVLNVAAAKLTLAAEQSDPVLDNLPPMVRNGIVVPPDRLRLTENQAVDIFVRRFRTFEDAEYLDRERNYKWAAHELTHQHLVTGQGRRSVESRDPENLLAGAMREVIHATNLLATQEMIRLNEAFKVPGAARLYAQAVLAFTEAPSAETFAELVEAVEGLPAKPGKNVLTWPVVTLIPYLADPTRHMMLKPEMTKRVAETFMFDLLYTSRPRWDIYQRLMLFGAQLLNRLRPLGARDFIDVHSFIWVIGGLPFMKKAARAE